MTEERQQYRATDKYAAPDQNIGYHSSQLNTFSTVVSIMAVVISIIITLGGYFATSATTVEKLDRLEKSFPKLESLVQTMVKDQYKDALDHRGLETLVENHIKNYEKENEAFRKFRQESEDRFAVTQRKEGQLEEKIRQLESRK